MNQGDKPDLLLFHGPSCLDGWGCAWVIHTKWPDVECREVVYGQDPPDVAGLKVLIADFSYPEEVLKKMAKVARGIVVLDHHASSEAAVTKLIDAGVIKGIHDQTRSGAALTHEYAYGNRNAPKLIEHIQDRDLWRFDIEGTREVCALLYSWGPKWDQWKEINEALGWGRKHEVIPLGAAIIRAEQRLMRQVVMAAERRMVIGGREVPVVNAPFFWASEIGHANAISEPFAATYMDTPDGRQFSLRTRQPEEHPVNGVAEHYGKLFGTTGGGHPGAAGFMAPAGWEGDVLPAEPTVDEIKGPEAPGHVTQEA